MIIPAHYLKVDTIYFVKGIFNALIRNAKLPKKANPTSRARKYIPQRQQILSKQIRIPNSFHSTLDLLHEQSDKKMSQQARSRIRIKGEGVLQDGTRYSREINVIETLETDGSTKETSEEKIKIGQEKVCFVALKHF